MGGDEALQFVDVDVLVGARVLTSGTKRLASQLG
jgi:hypothetical protein